MIQILARLEHTSPKTRLGFRNQVVERHELSGYRGFIMWMQMFKIRRFYGWPPQDFVFLFEIPRVFQNSVLVFC